jgi:zona occludens toxin
MITLGTGLPGNGKTLFMLWYIAAKAKKEQREVYYSGINIVDKQALPWTEFKSEDWPSLPKGAIIVIDEAQFVFPKKPNGAKLPDHYEKLATHRHSGFDIFLITQHPSLVDNFVRQLVGQHFHSVRKFGLERASIYEWSAANPAPQNVASQKSAIVLKWAYPKEVYGWYKSAEVHTVKKGIPAKLVLALLLVVAVLAAGYWSLSRYQSRYQKAPDASPSAVPAPGGVALPVAPAGAGAPGRDRPFDPVEDARHYVQMATPRVAGLPHTAPKYDEITQPVRAPVPAACLQVGSVRSSSAGIRCKCYSQQGTPMDVEFNMCIEFARNGYFQDFDADKDREQVERRAFNEAVLASRVADHGGRVVVIPDMAPAGAAVGAQAGGGASAGRVGGGGAGAGGGTGGGGGGGGAGGGGATTAGFASARGSVASGY